jgi:hypothetical protein
MQGTGAESYVRGVESGSDHEYMIEVFVRSNAMAVTISGEISAIMQQF